MNQTCYYSNAETGRRARTVRKAPNLVMVIMYDGAGKLRRTLREDAEYKARELALQWVRGLQ